LEQILIEKMSFRPNKNLFAFWKQIFSFKELVDKREKLFTSFLPSSSFKGVTRRVKTDLNALIALKNS
tara:strand:- start:496 stop:699 length:204 start_codon:yes stop_codon:yes gene_type:complete